MSSRLETVVLGGGLAGLSAAYHLGGGASVYEQRDSLGGLCQQIRADGFRFDAVPHVLHFKHEATRQLINRLLGGRLQSYQRRAGVYSHGTYTRYPFQAHLFGLPAWVIDECIQGRLRASRHGQADTGTFERWILSTFGEGIARHFMAPYNAKFWTLQPSELTCEWLDGLVPVPTEAQTIRGATSEDPSEYGYNVEFWYPAAGGLGAIVEALLAQVPALHLGKHLLRIDTTARVLRFADGEEVAYGALLTSVPMPELSQLLDPLPAEVAQALALLRWTSICVVHLGVRGEPPLPWHWVYAPQPDVVFYRAGLPGFYAPDAAPPGHYIISAEISYAPWRGLDRGGAAEQAIRDLIRLGLLRCEEDVVVRLPVDLRYGYPIYDRNYAWATAVVRDYLGRHDLAPIGRFGSWRYLSMEQTLLDGQRAAQAMAAPSDDDTVRA